MVKITYDHRDKVLGGAFAIQDPAFENALVSYDASNGDTFYGKYTTDEFCEQYLEWIKSTSLSRFVGLEDFKYPVFSAGTTEAFDKFYMKNHTRRFRCFKGEYMYHQLAWRNSWPNWQYLENDLLDANDAVIISLPFADTGNKHESYEWLMNKCTELKIPVLIDCAYYGISSNIIYDFTYPCITDIAFSVSKYFPIAHARVGMRLTRINDDDPLFVYQYRSYNNKYGAKLGSYFLSQFSPDYITVNYKHKQIEFANILGVEPSNTVMFALGDSKWQEYNRGGSMNRLSFHKYLHLDTDEFIKIIKEEYGNLLT